MRSLGPLLMALFLSGCAVVDGGVELTKTIWGSSTRALEQARTTAIAKTYDKDYWAVVRAAFSSSEQIGRIFKKDEVRGYFVLIGIKGCVDTTEVGVFFVEVNDHQTRVEVSSLSTNAKRIVSKALFHQLDIDFGLALPDPEVPISNDKDVSKVNAKP